MTKSRRRWWGRCGTWVTRSVLSPVRDDVLHPDPRWAVTVSSYRIEPTDGGCRFVVETRVLDSTDAAARRTFRRYWPTVKTRRR